MPLSFDGQRILILGAGVTGNAVARSLVKRGAAVSFADENPVAKSESQESSFSPERAETTVLKLLARACFKTFRVEVTKPF